MTISYANINNSLILLLCGMAGVFVVLLLFYIMIKLMQSISNRSKKTDK